MDESGGINGASYWAPNSGPVVFAAGTARSWAHLAEAVPLDDASVVDQAVGVAIGVTDFGGQIRPVHLTGDVEVSAVVFEAYVSPDHLGAARAGASASAVPWPRAAPVTTTLPARCPIHGEQHSFHGLLGGGRVWSSRSRSIRRSMTSAVRVGHASSTPAEYFSVWRCPVLPIRLRPHEPPGLPRYGTRGRCPTPAARLGASLSGQCPRTGHTSQNHRHRLQ